MRTIRVAIASLGITGVILIAATAHAVVYTSDWSASSGKFPHEVCPTWVLGADAGVRTLGGGSMTLCTSACQSNLYAASVETDDAPHRYRLEITQDGNVRLFYDGSATPLIESSIYFNPNFPSASSRGIAG